MKKVFSAAVLLCLVLCAGLLGACEEREEYVFDNTDRCAYVLNERGDHVDNIDKEKYLGGAQPPQKQLFDVREYGASPSADPAENAAAVNAALADAAAAGGAAAVVGGTYYSGTIFMQTGATLYIAADAELSLPRHEDLTEGLLDAALITARGADDWLICGPGKLNGQGTDWTEEADESGVYYPPEEFELKERVLEARKRIRPRRDEGCHVIYAQNCRNIAVKDLLIYEGNYWTVKLENCNGAELSGVVVDNNIYVANSDGVDICSSSNVRVRDCFIATGDDGVVIKTPSGAAENILVENCEIMSLANNFKIGTETSGDVRGVEVRDCYFFTAECAGGYAGIAVESADGALLSDIYVHDIIMDNVTSPLLIWLGCRLDKDNGADGEMGGINGVTVENIDANNIDIGCAVVGCEYKGERYLVQNAVVRNVKAVYRDCYEKVKIYRGDKVLEAGMSGYPEITRVSHRYFISHSLSAYYDLPVFGIYVRDVENFTLENFEVTPRQGNTRPLTNYA